MSQVNPEDVKKAVDTVAELRKMLEERLKAVDELGKKVAELEKTVSTLKKRVVIQRAIIKYLIKKMVKERASKPLSIVSRPRPERVFKSEEVRKKLEELRKKIMEKKKASRLTTPRPDATTTPEPAGEASEDFREFIKKVLSGKATASDIPARFRALPEVKIEGKGERK